MYIKKNVSQDIFALMKCIILLLACLFFNFVNSIFNYFIIYIDICILKVFISVNGPLSALKDMLLLLLFLLGNYSYTFVVWMCYIGKTWNSAVMYV